MTKVILHTQLRYMAILGNGLFIAWIIFNGIDEGFSATPVQKASYLALITLLVLNAVLLIRKPNS